MIVLHILWTILKIAGIILLILLGLLLLVFLAVLFCPVVYQAEGRKDADSLCGRAGVSWLFHLISFKIWYENQEMDYAVRIFGIPLKRVLKFLEQRQEKKTKRKQDKAKKSEEKPELTTAETKQEISEIKAASEKGQSVKDAVEEKTVKEKTGHKVERKNRKLFSRLKAIIKIPGKIINALKNFRLTVREICGKMEKIRGILESRPFEKGKMLILSEAKSLNRHFRPRKVEGDLKFGMEDPCLTGKILAAAGIFYPLYGEHFTIEPYFDENILEGNIFIRGRIFGIFPVITAWKLLWDSNIRYIVKKFKQL